MLPDSDLSKIRSILINRYRKGDPKGRKRPLALFFPFLSHPMNPLQALQERIGYRFKDVRLLEEGLTHPSALLDLKVSKDWKDYERLELLGDAVLSLILAETLFTRLPDAQEGFIAQARAVLGHGNILCAMARELQLSPCLRMSPEEALAGGAQRNSILEDALEAIIGAIYLDSDLATTKTVVLAWYGNITEGLDVLLQEYNPKGKLQEWAHTQGSKLRYVTDKMTGPAHDRIFHVSLYAGDTYVSKGKGSSKKGAQEAAAREALLILAEKSVERAKG